MNPFKKAISVTPCAAPAPSHLRLTLLLVLLTAQVLPTMALAQTCRLNASWPAFDYDGKPAQADGSCSKATVAGSQIETPGYAAQTRTMTAVDGRLQVRLDGKSYKGFPAEEYAVLVTSLSKTEPTGIVANFRSLKISLDKPESSKPVVLHVLRGSTCKATDFIPEASSIETGKERILTTTCGRSSNDFIPFLELSLDDQNGYLFAVGWTGSWKTRFANTGQAVEVEIGMERTNFRLLPGETTRQPSVLVLARKNQTRREFKTLVHRFMLENKVPRDPKGHIIPPILAVASGGGNKTPKMMADILQYSLDNKIPFDTYWVDAGWYGAPHEDELYSNCGPNWWKYVGDWRVNTTTHPTGDLLPIANAVHKAGLKFLLWFEPERMTDSAPILQTHPEYRHGQLVDYSNPDALRWIQDTVYGIIAKHKIDIYRQDFNMDPGPVWRGMDAADRIGIAEAKHITGMYQFLDDMRARFPDILQENCSSGGRRIDIEMISRAHTYCRSDYYIGRKPGDTAFILGQNATLNLMPYLPFQGCEFNCVPVGDDYAAFSIISSGTVITPSDFDGGIIRRKITDNETAWFKKVFDVAVRMRPLYMGDFYQLTDETGAGDDVWCAWQCHRPDLKAGFAIVFRRGAAADESRTFQLGGIDPNATYQVDGYDGSKKTVPSSELKDWTVTVQPRSFQLVFYQKQ
ncbi:MAG: alpha-galactosidase [Pirellulales bacterium]|nr:alpha-galactosidase [Pirellulales bacterium]